MKDMKDWFDGKWQIRFEEKVKQLEKERKYYYVLFTTIDLNTYPSYYTFNNEEDAKKYAVKSYEKYKDYIIDYKIILIENIFDFEV